MMTDTMIITKEETLENHYFFTAEGRMCSIKDNEDLGVHEHIVRCTEYDLGDKVYLIRFKEVYYAAHRRGWIVVYDPDRLSDEVFKNRESIITAVGENCKKKDVMQQFMEILDQKGFRYDEDFVNMD